MFVCFFLGGAFGVFVGLLCCFRFLSGFLRVGDLFDSFLVEVGGFVFRLFCLLFCLFCFFGLHFMNTFRLQAIIPIPCQLLAAGTWGFWLQK